MKACFNFSTNSYGISYSRGGGTFADEGSAPIYTYIISILDHRELTGDLEIFSLRLKRTSNHVSRFYLLNSREHLGVLISDCWLMEA